MKQEAAIILSVHHREIVRPEIADQLITTKQALRMNFLTHLNAVNLPYFNCTTKN
jgi:hypothetical protein